MLDITIDTSKTDTAQPMFAGPQTLPFVIEKIEAVEADGDKPQKIKFVLKLMAPAKSKDGGDILPGGMGSTLTEFISVTPKAEAKDPKWHERRLASIQDAALGTGLNHPSKPARPIFNAECAQVMLGKQMYLVIKLGKNREGRDQNSVEEFIFPGDLKA